MSERISLVLVPVNRSPAADAATCHAALLARLLQASLQLVHVMPLNPAELSDLPANRQTEADHDRAQRLKVAADAFAHARRLIGDDFEPPLREVSLEEEGFVRHPGRTIAAYANRQSNCLLVIGARHLSDLGKFIEGSVSDEVVHKANCPVTVVHPEAAPRDIARIGRVVLPVDGSRHSDEAALLAGDLARSAEAPVDLLFCRPSRPARSTPRPRWRKPGGCWTRPASGWARSRPVFASRCSTATTMPRRSSATRMIRRPIR